MHTVNLPENVFNRLQSHATPLVDNAVDVIIRALDALDATSVKPVSETVEFNQIKDFSAHNAPDLLFTTVTRVNVYGEILPPSETYWSNTFLWMIGVAAKNGMSTGDIKKACILRYMDGEVTEKGFKFVKEAGISIQSRSANRTWKAINHFSVASKIPVQLEWRWQGNEGSAFPNEYGRFTLAY